MDDFRSVILKGSRTAQIDSDCIASGIDSKWLMQNAGSSLAKIIINDFRETAKDAVKGVVVCGSGNNGGDGFVTAIDLVKEGFELKIFFVGPVSKFTADTGYYYEKLLSLKKTNGDKIFVDFLDIDDSAGEKNFIDSIESSEFVIDAIFGTGLHDREVYGNAGKIINCINSAAGSAVVYSTDIPSGIDSDNGKVLGFAVKADRTITFGCRKLGIAIYPGKEYAGDVIVADIGIPKEYYLDREKIYETDIYGTAEKIPGRNPYAYKHSAGKLLVVAGSPGFTGAASMTCQAAMRSGAGIVTLVCPWELNNIFEIKLTEVMTFPVEQNEDGTLPLDAFGDIENLSQGYDAIAIGPGLSKNPSTICLVREILKKIKKPTVLDADGLRALYGPKNLGEEDSTDLSHVIITPHSGELASILGTDKIRLEDRFELNRTASKRFGLVSVLKGAASLINNPEGETYINPTGSWALATAGTGDVLTGIIGSFLCQGMDLTDAAVAGTFIHGLASDLMLEKTGRHSQIATDLLEGLVQAFLIIENIKYERGVK